MEWETDRERCRCGARIPPGALCPLVAHACASVRPPRCPAVLACALALPVLVLVLVPVPVPDFDLDFDLDLELGLDPVLSPSPSLFHAPPRHPARARTPLPPPLLLPHLSQRARRAQCQISLRTARARAVAAWTTPRSPRPSAARR